MGATRTYGIPKIVESMELFSFNNGRGTLRIRFANGIPDPKFKIPATYTTDSPFEQLVIEASPQFGRRIFRYGPKGEIIRSSVEDIVKETREVMASTDAAKEKNAKLKKNKTAASTSVYNDVETIGQATEILLDLGVKADELGSPEAIVSAMMREHVSFPNLKFE